MPKLQNWVPAKVRGDTWFCSQCCQSRIQSKIQS